MDRINSTQFIITLLVIIALGLAYIFNQDSNCREKMGLSEYKGKYEELKKHAFPEALEVDTMEHTTGE